MTYGLLGEKLGHSFSKDIHQRIADYEYNLIEVAKENFDNFMIERNFKAINVTIPYKELVIPYLDYIDDKAKEINAVNTIVNNEGKLFGYNTDYYGLRSLILNNNIQVNNKKALIFGTGGTSKTAAIVLKDLGAREVIKVSRNKKDDCITYQDLYCFNDVDVIINTTPSGMYPNVEGSACGLDYFKNLSAVVDVIYNPLNTTLTQEAAKLGIKAVTGLYMLVAQAVYASNIFLNKSNDDISDIINQVYLELLHQKENIVLVGMPSCGKSTIGKILATMLNKEFVDSDEEIEKIIKMKISDFLTKDNEKEFREIESTVIKELSLKNNLVISTGGGVIKKDINVTNLRYNSKIIFIDRPLELLQATSSRPLSNNFKDLEKLYQDRYSKYQKAADYVVVNKESIDGVVSKILEYVLQGEK